MSAIREDKAYRVAANSEESLRRSQILKSGVSRAVMEVGGTMSHQHGNGMEHLPYLSYEKQILGTQALQEICDQFDPQGLMNPGKLVNLPQEVCDAA